LLNAYFLSIRIFEQLAHALKNRVGLKFFTVLKYFLSFRNFEQLALAQKTGFAEKFFKMGTGSPASYAYGPMVWTEDENTIFYIAWKMTISKQHEYALCPLNGLCLFGSKIRGYYCY